MVGCCLFARTIKSSISLFSTFQSENMSLIYLFHCSGFVLLKLIISVSAADIDVCKRDCHLCAHCGSVYLDRGVVPIEILICFAYSVHFFLLWDICVEACNV